jgi:hypothetical protein
LLRVDIFVCNLKPALETSQLRIDAPYVAQEDHENVAVVLFCGRRVCCGRLHAPAGSSKDIQFPRSGKASLKIVEFDRNDNGRILRSDWPDDPLAIASAGGRAVDRRKITRPSNATRCPCFLHAFKSQLEV